MKNYAKLSLHSPPLNLPKCETRHFTVNMDTLFDEISGAAKGSYLVFSQGYNIVTLQCLKKGFT